MSDRSPTSPAATTPLAPGTLANLRYDAIAGFLVFLIAMPLCLAIARASGFPPIAGIWTAVIGGLLCSRISNSEMTIKGPAAGLIVIVFGAVTELGSEFGAGMSESEQALIGYRLALGIGVAAGVVQTLFGLVRAGRLVDFFPLTPVHGLLAAIGVIIISKQLYEVIGVSPTKGAGPLELLAQFPLACQKLNPEIALIGLVSLIILFGLPLVKLRWVKKIPTQLVVLILAIGLGMLFDLDHPHTYLFPTSFFSSADYQEHLKSFEVGPRFLIEMPHVLQNPSSAFAFPDFRGLATPTGWKYLALFAIIGSLESLLSAKAIELLDPWRRKTNFDRDLMAVGLANSIAALIGALPMISEIVRSSANITNGARTRNANLCHGLFLLAFVLLLPDLIHQIPLAALGAMLVYTGFKLASPREFVRTYRVGSEQFVIFMTTILVTLATDLLLGIAAGIAVKFIFHLWHGVPVTVLLRSKVEMVPDGDLVIEIFVKKAAVFSNWLSLKNVILEQAQGRDMVVLDLSETRLVDHSVMEKLHEMERQFEERGKQFIIRGLDDHQPLSAHPLAARRLVNASPPTTEKSTQN